MSMDSWDKHISEENFRKVGLDVIIIDYLPKLREIVLGGKEREKELSKLLEIEKIKNAELHEVILGLWKPISLPTEGENQE